MMINGYSKLRNLKQAADETKQTHGNPIGATYIATMLEFFGGIFLIIGLIVPHHRLYYYNSIIVIFTLLRDFRRI
jgi:uncharacterized membrane protein YphA (DoxX/SURF4 family)